MINTEEHTPSTEEVRLGWSHFRTRNVRGLLAKDADAEFDRWLATVKAEAVEAAEEDTDWEYTYADMAGDPDTAHFREWGGVPRERAGYRRRKAGPWEKVTPVKGGEKGEVHGA